MKSSTRHPGVAPYDQGVIHPKEMATVWVIRGGEGNRLVGEFLRDGCIGLEYADFPDGTTIDRAKAIELLEGRRVIFDEADEGHAASSESGAAMFLSFVRRMEIGDVVFMPDPRAKGLACGVVTGDYTFHADLMPEHGRHRRSVDWRARLLNADLPERLDHVPRQRKVLDDVADGKLRALAIRCCAGELGEDPHARPARAPSGGGRARA